MNRTTSDPSANPPADSTSAARPRLLAVGDRALLLEFPTLDAVLAALARLSAGTPDGVVDLVPAARTVLVTLDPARLGMEPARRWLQRTLETAVGPGVEDASAVDPAASAVDVLTVPVHYDGPDLDAVAAILGLTPAELVTRHQRAVWRVAFSGFAPGFGYLVSADWPFDVPRLSSPRTVVPAGSVGLAGEFTGAYPRSSPGGWQLIARTDAVLWNPDAAPPALLVPGGVVRFVEAGATP